MYYNEFPQRLKKLGCSLKSICFFYVLLWVVWSGTVQADPRSLTNIRNEPVPEDAPVVVSSHYDATVAIEQVPEYAGASEGPGFLDVMALSSSGSFERVKPAMSADAVSFADQTRTRWAMLEKGGMKLSSKRYVVIGHASRDGVSIVSPTQPESPGMYGFPRDTTVNIPVKRLGERLGKIIPDGSTVDMTVCSACATDLKTMDDFALGLKNSGVKNARIRGQSEEFLLRDGKAYSARYERGTVRQYIEGEPLRPNEYEGGRVIEDGNIRHATEVEVRDWSESGFRQRTQAAASCK